MTKAEKFVRSVYPDAEIQFTASGRLRVVSEPTEKGFFLGKSFEDGTRNKWASAAKDIRAMMLRKLEQ